MYRTLLILLLLLLTGCKKTITDTDKAAIKPSPDKAAPNTPVKIIIESGRPEFDAMLADFKENPKTKKYERDIVTFVMTVESVKEVDKGKNYLVSGSGAGVNLVCTFLIAPGIEVNKQVSTVAPGNKLTYMAEPASYKPGTPPTITGLSGSILAIERK